MNFQTNPQLDFAFDYVRNTNKNIFLTGKAGTGKTTFLHQIKYDPGKRTVVVAPTGVAAINAGGMTIHSFFQLPFGPYLPGNAREAARQRRFSREKIRLIKSVDLLVIDEISMVRADLLDGIDDVLRRYKDHYQPFGGVQLLMIGDLHQLPPVVKEEEWMLLREYYETPYFFSSRALKQTDPVSIELKHIYRQSDETFIRMLNKVRDNQLDAEMMETLNSRYVADFQPKEEDAYITLTAHNASAQDINMQKLAALSGNVCCFKADIQGDFPTHAYPTDELLELKIAAQVMFVKNDMSREKRYYNGKIGRITGIREDAIYVRCPDDPEEIAVSKAVWDNMKYSLNDLTKEVSEEIIGTFTQYPLKLAWAITIHKSQGLTFERAIIDAQAAFAHGQVYVALSRCKSFEGIVLRSRIGYSSVKTDSTVKHYTEEAEKKRPDEAHLLQSKTAFQQSLIEELFGFKNLKRCVEQMNRIFLENENTLLPEGYRLFQALSVEVETHIFAVANKFRPQLQAYFAQPGLPEENAELQARIQKASVYFSEKLGVELLPAAKNIRIMTDNKAVQKTASEALENLQKELYIKNACFSAAKNVFSSREYLRVRANADIDFKFAQSPPQLPATKAQVPKNTPHPELYLSLKQWREDMAGLLEMELYEVLPSRTLLELVQFLPRSLAALKKIKGIGAAKTKQFGPDLVGIIQEYCSEHKIALDQILLPDLPEPIEKLPKPDTKTVSFELYKAGKSLDEIAEERGFVRATIEGHLAYFVGTGELDIFGLMDETRVRELEQFFIDNNTAASTEAKAYFGEAYSYGEIKMVLTWMKTNHL